MEIMNIDLSLPDLNRLHVIQDPNGHKFCIISIAQENFLEVGVFYDKAQTVDYIKTLGKIISEKQICRFKNALEISTLPYVSYQEPLFINGFAAYFIVRSIVSYLSVISLRNSPGLTSEEIETLNDYRHLVLIPRSDFNDVTDLDPRSVPNSILLLNEDAGKPLVFVLSSRDQWEEKIFGQGFTTSKFDQATNKLLNISILPDVSPVAMIKIEGYLAIHLFKLIAFDTHLMNECSRYKNPSEVSGMPINVSMN